ncbi:hypothetical protein L9F63_026044, partial [Diploptera punctata]
MEPALQHKVYQVSKPNIAELNSTLLYTLQNNIESSLENISAPISFTKLHLSSIKGFYAMICVMNKMNFMENNSRVVGMNLYQVTFTISIINNSLHQTLLDGILYTQIFSKYIVLCAKELANSISFQNKLMCDLLHFLFLAPVVFLLIPIYISCVLFVCPKKKILPHFMITAPCTTCFIIFYFFWNSTLVYNKYLPICR